MTDLVRLLEDAPVMRAALMTMMAEGQIRPVDITATREFMDVLDVKDDYMILGQALVENPPSGYLREYVSLIGSNVGYEFRETT